MPSLKEIKNRIASVNSTRKITSAMKMVASSKLHHAQVMIDNMLPYESMLEHILKTFLASEADAQTIFSEERDVKKVAIIVFSSNSSLCGGFNANIIKSFQNAVKEYNHLGRENILIYPIGRKIAEKVNKLGYTSAGDYTVLCDHPNAQSCLELAREIARKFKKGELDKVELQDVRGFEGIKEASYNLGGVEVKVAVAHGMKSAKVLLDQIREGKSPYTFIEIMGCPGGCIAGGGQPYVRPCFLPNEDVDILDTYKQKRAAALYEEDQSKALRVSHKNPQIIKLYEDFLVEPCGHKSHELLHTHYTARKN